MIIDKDRDSLLIDREEIESLVAFSIETEMRIRVSPISAAHTVQHLSIVILKYMHIFVYTYSTPH